MYLYMCAYIRMYKCIYIIAILARAMYLDYLEENSLTNGFPKITEIKGQFH